MTLQSLLPFFKSMWTVWFFALFLFLVARALWPSRKSRFEALARIPLDDGLARRVPKE
jgi:cbb3-type cytochrome oxidase subunit 3